MRRLLFATLLALVLLVPFSAAQVDAIQGVATSTLTSQLVITTTTGTVPTFQYVTVNHPFPDGNTTAQCFVQILGSGSGFTTQKYGSCGNASYYQLCSAPPVGFTHTYTSSNAPNDGDVVDINGSYQNTGTYDRGTGANGCQGGGNNSLVFQATGLPDGSKGNVKIIFYWNNDENQTTRAGCASYTDGVGGGAGDNCGLNTGVNEGEFEEVTVQSNAVTGYEYCGTTCNVPLGGFFIESLGTTAASYSRLSVHRSRGVTTCRWYSSTHPLGFNVYDGSARINRHLVTSTSHWYHFRTRRAVQHLRIVAVH